MALEMLAKAGPKLVQYAPKAIEMGSKLCTVGNINAAMAMGKVGADYYTGHHPKRDSSKASENDPSKGQKSQERRSRHDRRRRPTNDEQYGEPPYLDQRHGQVQQILGGPLPYPTGPIDMPLDDASFYMNQNEQLRSDARRDPYLSKGTRRNSFTPTPGSDDRQDYFDTQIAKGHMNALLRQRQQNATSTERRRSSINQRRMLASFDQPSNPPLPVYEQRTRGAERTRPRSMADRGYSVLPPPALAETYPAYPPSQVSSTRAREPPSTGNHERQSGAERMATLALAAQAGVYIPPPPIPLPRQYSNSSKALPQTRPTMPRRYSSGIGSSASSSASSSCSQGPISFNKAYGSRYSDMA